MKIYSNKHYFKKLSLTLIIFLSSAFLIYFFVFLYPELLLSTQQDYTETVYYSEYQLLQYSYDKIYETCVSENSDQLITRQIIDHPYCRSELHLTYLNSSSRAESYYLTIAIYAQSSIPLDYDVNFSYMDKLFVLPSDIKITVHPDYICTTPSAFMYHLHANTNQSVTSDEPVCYLEVPMEQNVYSAKYGELCVAISAKTPHLGRKVADYSHKIYFSIPSYRHGRSFNQ